MKLIATALAALLAIPAHAQQRNCAPSLVVIAALEKKYGETNIEEMEAAQPGSETVIQWHMWLNEETGSWTLTGTLNGVTCMFAGAPGGYDGETIADFILGEAA